MEDNHNHSSWHSGVVKLALAGTALLMFMGFSRSCDGNRHAGSGSTTRPSGSRGYYGGGGFWRSSGSSYSPSRSSGYSTSRGGFGSRSSGIS